MSRLAVRSARRGMRIMSADVVPGVAKSARNGGGQVTQKLTPTAAAGADRLKQMVAQQAAAKKNAVIEAQLAHEEQEALDALVGKTLEATRVGDDEGQPGRGGERAHERLLADARRADEDARGERQRRVDEAPGGDALHAVGGASHFGAHTNARAVVSQGEATNCADFQTLKADYLGL